jgi:hypothetical protein
MNKSHTLSELAKAMILFQVKVESIKKDANNPFFKSKYASLSNILDAIKEPLIESGLTVMQFPTGEHGLSTLIIHESGEYLRSDYTMRPVKDDPQGRGSAITYARRYALAAALSLNIDEDDDGNLATHGKSHPEDREEKQWLNKNTELFNKAVRKLQTNETTIDKIKAAFKVSKEVETLLLNSIN